METSELRKALSPFVLILDDLGIPYYIGGSVASSTFGLPRSTMDIDIVADIKKSQVKDLVVTLQNEYYIDGDVIIKAIERKSSFNLIHFETMMKIDVFILKNRSFDKEAFRRKKMDVLGGEQEGAAFYFSSPEDIIISKLEWFKMGGEVSERQWKDIIGVLRVQGESLDYNYLKRWAEELSAASLLDRALEETKTRK